MNSSVEQKFITDVELKIASTLNRLEEKIPYSGDSNNMYTKDFGELNLAWWTNGFWPGILWQQYAHTNDSKYKRYAELVEEKFDRLFWDKYEELYHDVGFMWTLTSLANFKLTNNQLSKTRALHAANILAGRFNPVGEYIVAWNYGANDKMIIDSLMNIPLLFWASSQIDDPRYRNIAIKHGNTALKHIIREDGSCNHICSFDPNNGQFLGAVEGQGYSKDSAWSRGQSWGIYGFALLYKHTKDSRFLAAASKVANYFIRNIALTNWIADVDFKAPRDGIFSDSSASVIAASGLLELAKYSAEVDTDKYTQIAHNIFESIVANSVDLNIDTDVILNGVSEKYHNDQVCPEIGIIYGDYYLLELAYKLHGQDLELW